MKRRTIFKHLAAATAAAWLLPSCISDPKKVSIALNRLQVAGDEEALLEALADTMIPQTDSPGARTVGAHLFALVMVDDCLSKSEQEKFLEGMRRFDNAVSVVSGKPFMRAPGEERLKLLTTFEAKLSDADEAVRSFYTKTKGYIIQGYTSSQHFLTEVKPYQLVPGPNYNGCAPVPTDSKRLS